jgi:hypothetical protein
MLLSPCSASLQAPKPGKSWWELRKPEYYKDVDSKRLAHEVQIGMRTLLGIGLEAMCITFYQRKFLHLSML